MAALEILETMRARIAAVVPDAAVVSVHAQDLSDANTRKWLVRLPGIYLIAERIERRGTEAVLAFRAFLLARLADMRQSRAQAGWAMAELALAAICTDPHVTDARLVYRDEAGLDQPGIALWEIEARRSCPLPPVDDTLPDCTHAFEYEELYSSWAPWIGAAHEGRYQRIDGEAPETGVFGIEEMLP